MDDKTEGFTNTKILEKTFSEGKKSQEGHLLHIFVPAFGETTKFFLISYSSFQNALRSTVTLWQYCTEACPSEKSQVDAFC